jgi:hypothetical protein
MRYVLTPITTVDSQTALDLIWAASQDSDDRGFRRREGWWSLSEWAERAELLRQRGRSRPPRRQARSRSRHRGSAGAAPRLSDATSDGC